MPVTPAPEVVDELELRIYDPWADPQPQPHPVDLYVGTGIAGLYNGTITGLEGWTVLPHPNDRRP